MLNLIFPRLLVILELFILTEGSEDGSDGGGDGGFGGGPKPMLPYSSMFIFGPTNP